MTIDLDEPPVRQSAAPGLTKPVLIASAIQAGASVLMIALLFLEWVKDDHIGLSGSGGAGFGILALVTAVVGIVAVASRLQRRAPGRLLGPSQLAFMLAFATFFANLLFLWVFRTGGAPKWVYIAANLLMYSGVVGLFSDRSDIARPLDAAQVRLLGGLTALLGGAIACAPALGYTSVGGRTLTGFEPGAPRTGVLFLLVGGVTVFYGIQRIRRPSSLTDIGPYVLWCHVTIGLGVIATGPAFAWVVSGLWGNNFDVGIGGYVNLLLGLALVVVGVVEAKRRDAPGI